MEVGIEFVLYKVEMARLLVVFLKIQEVQPVVYSSLAKTSEDGFQEFNLFCYREIVYS